MALGFFPSQKLLVPSIFFGLLFSCGFLKYCDQKFVLQNGFKKVVAEMFLVNGVYLGVFTVF